MILVEVAYMCGHYSPVCGCMIPARWRAEVIAGLPDELDIAAYVDADTCDGAFDILRHEIRSAGYIGDITLA